MILDDDKIPVVVKMTCNGNISQNPRVYDSKYILKEMNLYYLGCPIGAVRVHYEIKKARAHTYTNINA